MGAVHTHSSSGLAAAEVGGTKRARLGLLWRKLPLPNPLRNHYWFYKIVINFYSATSDSWYRSLLTGLYFGLNSILLGRFPVLRGGGGTRFGRISRGSYPYFRGEWNWNGSPVVVERFGLPDQKKHCYFLADSSWGEFFCKTRTRWRPDSGTPTASPRTISRAESLRP